MTKKNLDRLKTLLVAMKAEAKALIPEGSRVTACPRGRHQEGEVIGHIFSVWWRANDSECEPRISIRFIGDQKLNRYGGETRRRVYEEDISEVSIEEAR